MFSFKTKQTTEHDWRVQATHLRTTCRGGVPTVAWSLMQDLMTGVLCHADWVKVRVRFWFAFAKSSKAVSY